MTDPEFLKDAAPFAVICAVIATLYFGFGLMTVIVAAALFDCALRAVEFRRARVLATARPQSPRGT